MSSSELTSSQYTQLPGDTVQHLQPHLTVSHLMHVFPAAIACSKSLGNRVLGKVRGSIEQPGSCRLMQASQDCTFDRWKPGQSALIGQGYHDTYLLWQSGCTVRLAATIRIPAYRKQEKYQFSFGYFSSITQSHQAGDVIHIGASEVAEDSCSMAS